MPRIIAALVLAVAAVALLPAGASANHHACPVVSYQPGSSGNAVKADIGYRPNGDKIAATYRGSNGVVRVFTYSVRSGHIYMSYGAPQSDGSVKVFRTNCTPTSVPAPIGGPTSPLPGGANVPVPTAPLAPGVTTPTAPDLAPGGNTIPLPNPLGPENGGPDFSSLKPNLGNPGPAPASSPALSG